MTIPSSFLALSAFLILSVVARANEHAPAGILPADALKALQAGNQRFISGQSQHAQQGKSRRRKLASGQNPGAIILSCSDSRVPPELVFDQGLGEVFAIRVAGNVLGAATVASIEYAVAHLGTRLIVVMGHESCGAVKAALTTPQGMTAGSADLDTLISMIQPTQEDAQGRMPASSSFSGDKTLRKPVMRNVDAVALRLVTRSNIIRKKVEAGDVQIVRAIYSLDSGKVDFWGLPEAGSTVH